MPICLDRGVGMDSEINSQVQTWIWTLMYYLDIHIDLSMIFS